MAKSFKGSNNNSHWGIEHWTFGKYRILCFLIYCRIRNNIQKTFFFSIARNEASNIFPFQFFPRWLYRLFQSKGCMRERKKNLLFLYLSAFLYRNYVNHGHHSNEFDHLKCSNAKNERLLCCRIFNIFVFIVHCSLSNLLTKEAQTEI